jgi:hypothetical protein
MGARARSALPSGAYRIQPEPAHPPVPPGVPPRLPPQLARASTRRLGRQRSGLTLRTRLIAALLSVAILPLTATAIGGVVLASNSLTHQGQQVLFSRASATATQIDTYLAGVRSSLVSSGQQVVELASADPAIGPDTLSAIEAVLRGDSDANGFQATGAAEYLDASGRIIASDQKGEEGDNLHASPTVQAALSATLTTPCKRAPSSCAILSGAAFNPDAPSDLRETLEVATPIYANGADVGAHPIGALRARFSMLDKIVGWVHNDADAQGGGGLLIEPDTGIVLAESLPPGNLTFTSLQLLSRAELDSLVKSKRFAPMNPGEQPATQPIPGLGRDILSSQHLPSCQCFTAGGFTGGGASSMLYVRVNLKNGPNAAPWVYLLGRPVSVVTAPAEQIFDVSSFPQLSLAQSALVIAFVALALALAIGIIASRWVSAWLVSAVQQLETTASAFLAFTNDQRQATEEQRHRLTAARTALHDLHRVAGELAEAIERAIGFAEGGRQGPEMLLLSPSAGQWGPFSGGQASSDGQQQAWWRQWARAMGGRLNRQFNTCNGLANEAQLTVQAASIMRQRGGAVSSRATAIEATLWPGGVAIARPARVGFAAQYGRASNRALRASTAGFNTGTLRLSLLGILVTFGLLPSLGFAATTGIAVGGTLASQSDAARQGQAQSQANAVDALLSQQLQEVAGLDTIYRSMVTPGSGITQALVAQGLAQTVTLTASNFGTGLLELASASSAAPVAASTTGTLLPPVANLPVFQVAKGGHLAISSAQYDVASHTGWYYIASPIRTKEQTKVIGVALGKFALTPISSAVANDSAGSNSAGDTYTFVVERDSALVVLDSRHPSSAFAAAAPEVASAVHTSGSSGTSRSFTGNQDASGSSSAYSLVPLANAPWDLVEAQPITVASDVANRLTRYDLILSLAVTVLTAGLALFLGQSIIIPVRRLRSRFRQAARRLVAITRRQDEAAQRQEAALPPIAATAQLLALETEEVSQLLFATYAPSAQPPHHLSPPPPPWDDSALWSGATGPGASGVPSTLGAPGRDVLQSLPPSVFSGAIPDQPPMEALRRARIVSNDWSLRQQRILADLATALNATDELSRSGLEGQQEAAELARLAVDLLASAR